MFQRVMNSGGSKDIKYLLKNGVFTNQDGITLYQYGGVKQSDNLYYFDCKSIEGCGVYTNEITNTDARFVLIKIKENSYSAEKYGQQYGQCNPGASLPTIVSNGTGRVSPWYYFARDGIIAIPIIQGKGIFLGGVIGYSFKVEEVFLL